ncbi:MAG TPA: hypothetical protein VF768_09610 [Holophagaceae bacterium]
MFRPLPLLLPALVVMAALPARSQSEEEGRMLYRFRVNHLEQNVGLSEDQARQVADRWARYDHDLFDTTRQIRDLRAQFNDILLGPGSEEEKNNRVRPLLERFVSLRRQQLNLKLQFEDDIRAHLSPAQQVRLIIQVEEMQRRMIEALRQGFGNRMGPGGRMGPGPGGLRRGGR